MTLDEHLREVDRWKDELSQKMIPLSSQERAKVDTEAIAWLETQLGRPLRMYSTNATCQMPEAHEAPNPQT